MESSSDDDFAWTDASDDTVSSISDNNMAKNTTNGVESDSDNSYKKKLHKELFDQENGTGTDENESKHKSKKRKLKREHSDDEHYSPIKKKIKFETDSELDNLSYTEMNGHHNSDNETEIKEEKSSQSTPTKSKKKHRMTISYEEDEISSNKSIKVESTTEVTYEKTHTDYVDDEEIENSSKKKKKKKKSKHREESPAVEIVNGDNTDNIIDIEETIASPKKSKKKKKHSDNDSQNDITMQTTVADISEISRVDIPLDVTVAHDLSNVKQKSRLSNRSKFENDVDDSLIIKKNVKSKKRSQMLSDFVEKNKITPIMPQNVPEIGDDDEIWIIRCPGEVDVSSFDGRKISFESKCKVKLNGQAYEGPVDDKSDRISILTTQDGTNYIRNIPIQGYINLHRRLPKIHIDESVITNNETGSIPLPLTKFRHPLLGIDYKKAIKLPSSVREKLRESAVEDISSSKKKKKKNKDVTCVDSPKKESKTEKNSDNEQSETISKKKRKRQSDREDEPVSKKAKKSSNPNTAEAWETEQAIEENLFNF